jgi:hypothetical protein
MEVDWSKMPKFYKEPRKLHRTSLQRAVKNGEVSIERQEELASEESFQLEDEQELPF